MDPLSIIASMIAIIGGTKTTYTTIQKIVGLPKAFKKVGNDFPFVQKVLQDAHEKLVGRQPFPTEESDAAFAIIDPCYNKAGELKRIFDEVEAEYKKYKDAKDWAKIRIAYHRALRGIKAHRVESLMKDILEGLHKLALSQVFKSVMYGDLKAIENAIQELSNVEPSVADSEFENTGSINASQTVATGAIAQMINTTAGTNTYNSGRYVIGGGTNTINFGKDP